MPWLKTEPLRTTQYCSTSALALSATENIFTFGVRLRKLNLVIVQTDSLRILKQVQTFFPSPGDLMMGHLKDCPYGTL